LTLALSKDETELSEEILSLAEIKCWVKENSIIKVRIVKESS
jgi:hypothetical protein